jgi:hypothetical protein
VACKFNHIAAAVTPEAPAVLLLRLHHEAGGVVRHVAREKAMGPQPAASALELVVHRHSVDDLFDAKAILHRGEVDAAVIVGSQTGAAPRILFEVGQTLHCPFDQFKV